MGVQRGLEASLSAHRPGALLRGPSDRDQLRDDALGLGAHEVRRDAQHLDAQGHELGITLRVEPALTGVVVMRSVAASTAIT